jgi:hypothetical protein
MICLDGSGALLRKGCACSSSWAHAECMARAAAAQRPRRWERAWSECQTCGQHFTGLITPRKKGGSERGFSGGRLFSRVFRAIELLSLLGGRRDAHAFGLHVGDEFAASFLEAGHHGRAVAQDANRAEVL